MSTNPWEETWTVAEDNYNDIQKVNTDNGVITGLFATVDGTSEQSKLAAAAPDMARALLRRVDGCANSGIRVRGCMELKMLHICAACEAKAALIKAGVL